MSRLSTLRSKSTRLQQGVTEYEILKMKQHEDYETIEVEYAEARASQTSFPDYHGPAYAPDGEIAARSGL